MLRFAKDVGTIDGVSSRLIFSGAPSHTSKHPLEFTRVKLVNFVYNSKFNRHELFPS